MKRIQFFSIRDMPPDLTEDVKWLFNDSLGHIVEYYPGSIDEDTDETEYRRDKEVREELDKWLASQGLDETEDEYRYVLITYQPE